MPSSLENPRPALQLNIPDTSMDLGAEKYKAPTSTTGPTFAITTPAVYTMANYAKGIISQVKKVQAVIGDPKNCLGHLSRVMDTFINELFTPAMPDERFNKLRNYIQSGLSHYRLAEETSKKH